MPSFLLIIIVTALSVSAAVRLPLSIRRGPVPSCVHAKVVHSAVVRARTVRCQQVDVDSTIDELLDVTKPEALPSLMGKRLQVLTDAEFLSRLEARLTSADSGIESTQLAQLRDSVLAFLEEVAAQIEKIEPEIAAAQAEADATTAAAKQKAAEARRSSTPQRRTSSATPSSAAAASPTTPREMRAKERETRAKNRFLVERLLDAANAGTDKLDALLRENHERLDATFFQHLQWEVDEQRKAKNRKMLNILEAVVQRACVEVEAGQPEVALLGALLQTRNSMVRREMYEREFKLDRRCRADVLADLLRDTQLDLEKKVLRGEMVDGDLLQQLRVIGVEVGEYDEHSDGDDVGV